jgi:hypothetical protein
MKETVEVGQAASRKMDTLRIFAARVVAQGRKSGSA